MKIIDMNTVTINTVTISPKSLIYSLLLISVFFLSACSTTSTMMVDDMADTEAMVIREAQFEDADASHQGSGDLKILQNGTERTVRFENFQGTPGPGLVVLLVENVAGKNKSEIGASVELGDLKSTNGNQNYTIPEGVDLSKYDGVMVYCKPFSVVFSRAAFK